MGIGYKVVIIGKKVNEVDMVAWLKDMIDIVVWLKEMYEAKIENVKITIEANTGEGEDCE